MGFIDVSLSFELYKELSVTHKKYAKMVAILTTIDVLILVCNSIILIF